jgi:hypothetical protein
VGALYMDKQKIGLIGLVTILLAFGGTVLLTPLEFESAYICAPTNQLAIFSRLSSTGKTGYYMDGNIEKSLLCKSGTTSLAWTKLSVYAADNNLEVNDILVQPSTEPDSDYVVFIDKSRYVKCYTDNGIISRYSKCYKNGVLTNYLGELVCGGVMQYGT